MEKLKKAFQKMFGTSIALSIITLIFGLILLLDTSGILSFASLIMGSLLVLVGVILIIKYFAKETKTETSELGFKAGIVLLILGLILIIFENILYILVPLIISIVIIINSINKIDVALIMKRDQYKKWYITMIIGILTLIAGICLLINPLGGTFLVTKGIGIIIIISASLDIIDTLNLKKELKKTGKKIKEIFK